MEPPQASVGQLIAEVKQFGRRLFTIGENRLELFIIEVQEERVRVLHALFLAFGMATLASMALLALNVAIVVLFWSLSPVGVLLALAGIYAAGAFYLYTRLARLLREWKTLAATLDQLQKDRECLKKTLE
jgi:uncharacterized membrane protein YqjE